MLHVHMHVVSFFSAGLESMKRLQELSLDHNELISTTGLSDMYTLLHLSCSHNHLTSVEGLENNALLHRLDLRANSLAEVKNKQKRRTESAFIVQTCVLKKVL